MTKDGAFLLKLYQRYLAVNFIPVYLMSILFFVSFLLTSQLFRLMRVVTKKGIDLISLLELFGQISLSFIPMAIPLSIIFAMIFCLNKLSEDSEIIAMRAMGVSKNQLFKPFLIIAVISAITVFAINRTIIPKSTEAFKVTVQKMTSSGFLADITKGKFYTDIPNVTLFAEDVMDDGKKLDKVFIKVRNSKKDQVILARRGALLKNDDFNNDNYDIQLDLFDGNITTVDNNFQQIEKINFVKYEFPIAGSGIKKLVSKDSMLTSRELSKYIGELIVESKSDLPEKDAQRIIRRLTDARLEYWSRLNVPLQCLAFVLIGFVFGIKKGRGKSGNTSLYAFLSVLLYYVIYFVGLSLVSKKGLSPMVMVFLPTFLTIFLGSYFYRKIDWAS